MITDKTGIDVGVKLVPDGGPESSAIEVLNMSDSGVTFKRLHPYWKGEEFMLRWDQLLKSHWSISDIQRASYWMKWGNT